MRKTLLFAFCLLLLQPAFSQTGALDPSYGNGGITAPVFPNSYYDIDFDDMAVQPDGKIVAIGQRDRSDGGRTATIVRYNTNGTLDKTFSGDGILTDTYFKLSITRLALTIQKDGKILVVGPSYINTSNPDYAHLYGFTVTRYNTNGALDTTLGKGGRVFTAINATGSSANSIDIDSDGKIIVSGTCFSDYLTPPYGAVVRYNNNGSVASIQTFYSGFGVEAYPFVAAYPTGGFAVMANGSQETNETYLYSSKFGEAALGLPSNVSEGFALLNPFIILPDEKIALATNNTVALLNTNGSYNTGFSGDGKLQLNFRPAAFAAPKDGKLLIGGADENGASKLERYKMDGTLDFTFAVPPAAEGISDIIIYGNRVYVLARHSVVAYQLDTNPRTVKVNLYGSTNPYNNGEWNNWNTYKSLNAGTLHYTDSTASSISAGLSARDGVVDNGSDYPGGMAPAAVLRYGSWAGTARTLTLSGLSSKRRYSIELYASRKATTNDTTLFAINGILKKIGTSNNYNSKAVFTNLTPNAQGKIIITISNTKTYNYLNGFILNESYTSTASTQATAIAMPKEEGAIKNTLQVTAFPNPSKQSFTVQLKGSSDKPVQLRIVDASGRVVETKQNMAANASLTIGRLYKPGVYNIETVQEGKRSLLKIVKE